MLSTSTRTIAATFALARSTRSFTAVRALATITNTSRVNQSAAARRFAFAACAARRSLRPLSTSANTATNSNSNSNSNNMAAENQFDLIGTKAARANTDRHTVAAMPERDRPAAAAASF